MPLLGIGMWNVDPKDVGKSVKAAVKAGIRCIDCAWDYGNETEVGNALKELFEEGVVKREDLFITSKLWCNFHAPEDVEVNLKDSLRMLGLDYLDLYLIHWPMAFPRSEDKVPLDKNGNIIYLEIPLSETWKGMEKAKRDGLVKNIGLSNTNSKMITDVWDSATIKPSVVQIEIQPYLSQEKLVNFIHSKGMAVTGYSNLGAVARSWALKDEPRVLQDEAINKLAAEVGKTPAQVILRWLVQRNIAVIPKSTNPVHIRENTEIFNFELTDDQMKTMNGLNRNYRYVAFWADEPVDGKLVFRDPDCYNFPFGLEF
jgi:diketogulonate reductase-like aldo/keto reductase